MVDVPYLRCSKKGNRRSSKYGKRRYDSPAAVRYGLRDGEGTDVYWCLHCGGWHRTHHYDSRFPTTRFQTTPDRITLYEGKYAALAGAA